jgi:DNA-binding NarL/FixJ family response regulator
MLLYTQNSTQPTAGYRVIICDDHPQMRGGLRNVLAGILKCDIVAETAVGEEAVELVARYQPDLLVLDLSLVGPMNGRHVLQEIRRRQLPVKIFVHTAFLNYDDFDDWIDNPGGPNGIDEKGSGDMELAIGFTQVLLTEQKYVPLRLIRKYRGRTEVEAFDCLAPKEAQVLKLAVRPELSITEIARELNYSSSTVRSYLTTIYAKLGLEQHSRAALIAFYYEHRGEARS